MIRQKKNIPHAWPPILKNEQKKVWEQFSLGKYPGDNIVITRKQLAILMNSLATNPFYTEIDFNGRVK